MFKAIRFAVQSKGNVSRVALVVSNNVTASSINSSSSSSSSRSRSSTITTLTTLQQNNGLMFEPVPNQFVRCYAKKAKGGAGAGVAKPKVELRKEEIDEVIDYGELVHGMRESVEKLKTDLNDNIQLRLTPSSFEQIMVNTPDGNMRVGEIAQVEVKSANMYQIDMIDMPDYVKPVYEAIQRANLNVNAQLTDKHTISLPIAKVTREHRESMAKSVRLKVEKAIKRMRDLENKALRKTKEAKNVSKDLQFNVSAHIKYQFEVFSKQAAGLKELKVKEVLKE